MPDTLNKKIIITGFAILLFSIIIAIISKATFSYILGGFGLFFVIAGCFIKDEVKKKP
ncbi:MAG: hypothetical protein PUC65_11165 [Clostridiales bacterium]|nr:hypothetical protein [Clostridiales bacterium]